MPIDLSSDTAINPISIGLRFGAAGAAAGLGWAGIRKAIRARRAQETGEPEQYTPVFRPMLAGAAIGAALGGGLGYAAWRNRFDNPGMYLAGAKKKMPTKYASLLPALEKKALFDAYAAKRDAHPIASLASSFIPGVGAAMSGADALNSFSKGKWLQGIGNVALMPLGLVGAGGLARVFKAMPRMARIAQAARHGNGLVAGRAAVQAGNTAMQQSGRITRGLEMAGAKMMPTNFANRIAGPDGMRWVQRGSNMERMFGVGEKFKRLEHVPGLNRITRFGATTTAGMMLPLAGGIANEPGDA